MNDSGARIDESGFFSYCLGDVTVRFRYNDITISEETFSAREPEYIPLGLDQILSE